MGRHLFAVLTGIGVMAVLVLGPTAGFASPITVAGQCDSRPSSMVSWWAGDGSAADLLGTNNGLLPSNTAFALGMVGKAFKLDSTQAIEIPDSPSLRVGTGDLSLDAWIQTRSTGGSIFLPKYGSPVISIINKTSINNGNLSGYEFFAATGGDMNDPEFVPPSLGFLMGTGDGGFLATSIPTLQAVNDGQFHHVAVMVSRTTGFRFMFDGRSLGAAGITTENDVSNTANLLIGGNFDGLIDEVEFFDRALANEEVQRIFEAGPAGKCKPPHGTPPPNAVPPF